MHWLNEIVKAARRGEALPGVAGNSENTPLQATSGPPMSDQTAPPLGGNEPAPPVGGVDPDGLVTPGPGAGLHA